MKALNKLWIAKEYPAMWNKEIKLPFLKPGKNPSLPSSYRPISLTSSICKLFERMVNHRLMWFLERHNILSPEQSGFRRNRSTMDALTQLTSFIEKGFKEKKHTIAVFFDLEKAYDTVWRCGILSAIQELGLRGNLPTFIERFLSSREFCVRVGAAHSEYIKQEEGLPQGSVFAIAINDITKQLGSEVRCTLYVDDFTIFTSSTNVRHSTRVIQLAINNVERWTKSKGMRFSSEKTVAVKFEKRRKEEEPHLTLHGSTIQVKEDTAYLGLIVDKRLNWRSHVDHVRAKCLSAINLIKHLSHLSWGADRRTLKQLHSALVLSKINYGAQVYGTFNSKVFKRLEPLQNACLRAITGAFRSTPAVSLCAETGILPLEFSRDLLNLGNLFKIQSMPSTPTHKAVIGQPTEEPSQRLEHLKELCLEYQVEMPSILRNSVSEVPPWTLSNIQLCPYYETGKRGLSEKELRANFLAHLEEHPSQHIYTDGSKTNAGVGFAAIFPNIVKSGNLTQEASIFTAEMYAIKMAVEQIVQGTDENRQFTIFSDSKSALLSLNSVRPLSPIVDEIKALNHRANEENKIISLCWVPGHVDIQGNEKADKAAKEAISAALEVPSKAIPHTDMKRPLREAVTNGWHRKWNALDRDGRKLREIKKDVRKCSSSHNKCRRIETILSRLRLGHTNITHAYLMQGLTDPPMCDRCNRTITVKHILVECRKYTTIRNKYFRNPTLVTMLGEHQYFSVNKLVQFLKETNLFNHI